jgi:hypothetical protein
VSHLSSGRRTSASSWNEQASGALVEGESFKIAYDVDRLCANLPANANGRIFANVSFDGQYPSIRKVRIPNGARSVRLWFSAGSYPSTRYDSTFGSDYVVQLQAK